MEGTTVPPAGVFRLSEWLGASGAEARTTMNKTLIACLLMALAGCGERAVEIRPTDNAAIEVETLFTKDGCTVYRFNDAGRRYFVRCDSGQTRTEWSESYPCGKSMCRRDVAIPGA